MKPFLQIGLVMLGCTLAGCRMASDPTTLTRAATVGDSIAMSGDLREAASMTFEESIASVRAVLTVTNTSATARPITATIDGMCDGLVVVRAWRVVDGSAVLAWDSSRHPPKPPCPVHLLDSAIAPGAHVTFGNEFPMSFILGDSLPAGPYLFTVKAYTLSPSLPAELTTSILTLSP
jgi:hypothetical protein